MFQQPSQVVPRGWPYHWQSSVPVTPPGKHRFFSHRWFFSRIFCIGRDSRICCFPPIFCIGRDSRIFCFFAHFLHWSGFADFFALQSSEIFNVHVDKYGMLSHTTNLEAALNGFSFCCGVPLWKLFKTKRMILSLSPYVKWSDSSFKYGIFVLS